MSCSVIETSPAGFREQSLDGDGNGWDGYRRYSAHIIPLLKARGGTVLWAGVANTLAFGPAAGGDWDYVSSSHHRAEPQSRRDCTQTDICSNLRMGLEAGPGVLWAA
jgi:hypothetical protein